MRAQTILQSPEVVDKVVETIDAATEELRRLNLEVWPGSPREPWYEFHCLNANMHNRYSIIQNRSSKSFKPASFFQTGLKTVAGQ
jgi:hypothetical protein